MARLLWKASRGELTEGEIRDALGDSSVRTQPDLGRVFGVTSNTIAQSWRENGLPGRTGNYQIADALIWVLERDKRNGHGRPKSTSEAKATLAELEVEDLRLQVELKRTKLLRERGGLIEADIVTAEICTLAAIVTNHVMGIPRKMHMYFPVEQAPEAIEKIEHECRMALTQLSEVKFEDFIAERDLYLSELQSHKKPEDED